MTSLYAKAWWQLIRFDIILWTQTFGTLYQKVRSYPLQHYVQHQAPTHDDIERVVRAFELACIWYPKHARCLHRSAALTCLLRNHGIPAFMVIGTQKLPFKAHAWVEVNECVVCDKEYTPEMYCVLDRC